MAIVGTLGALIVALPFGLLAARNVSPHPVLYPVGCLLLNAGRAVPEIIDCLTILSHSPSEAIKMIADRVLPALGPVEVLVVEAHIHIENGVQGYGMCLGRDQVAALGIAVIDSAVTAQIMLAPRMVFIAAQAEAQAEADNQLLRAVERTRVEM